MTPFQRLGLYSAAATVAGVLAWVTQNVGFYVGLAAAVGGIVLAVFATVELRQSLPPEVGLEEEGPTEEQRRDVLRARDRGAIVKDAVAAREEQRAEQL